MPIDHEPGSGQRLTPRFLLSLCSPHDPPADCGTLAGEIQLRDWEEIARQAIELRLGPLSYFRLRQSGLADRIPPPVLEMLRDCYHDNLGHNIHCSSLLSEIAATLSRGGIEVILLKGIAYMLDCYENPGERVLGDVDLLIRPEARQAAQSILLEAGYSMSDKPLPRGHHHLPAFVAPGGQAFEMHHHIAPAYTPIRLDIGKMWERKRPSSIAPNAFLLHPADCLIHTSIHLVVCSEIAGKIYQLVDTDKLVRAHFRSEESFRDLEARAGELGCSGPVRLSLSLARDLLETPLPDRLAGKSGWGVVQKLARATLAAPAGEGDNRHFLFRNLLSYRKTYLSTPSPPLRWLYVLSRPLALALESCRSLFVSESA